MSYFDSLSIPEDTVLLKLDLQFFADGEGGEKTEEPTSKKLNDARKEGQVAKSQELNSAISLIAVFLLLRVIGFYTGTRFLEMFNWVYSAIPEHTVITGGKISVRDFCTYVNRCALQMLLILLPILLVGFAISVIVNLVQVKWAPTTKPLMPKFNKLSPLSGVKRLFSFEKLFELLKSFIKILVIGYMTYITLKNKLGMIMLLEQFSLKEGVGLVLDTVLDLGLRISIMYLVVGIADYAYRKWKFHKDMMMTKQEVKDEYKNSEGDPQIKGKIRQKMREVSQRRMMAAIPQADVVITNPTHFAVALRYDITIAAAPIVVAKGTDFLAQKIKEVARENDVDIVENKPLARMIYHNVELGDIIPPELYQAVAEVLAMVYNAREQRS
ncbi:MAG: flagellar biosynthesis protein FlhB [Lachnospiraceae bacterium]|nr:flagellar biosynthesis protein FlhB [Lachnospiraceae bacterium]